MLFMLMSIKALSKTDYYVMLGAVAIAVFILLLVIFESAYRRKLKKYNKKLALAKQEELEKEDNLDAESTVADGQVVETNFVQTEQPKATQTEQPKYVPNFETQFVPSYEPQIISKFEPQVASSYEQTQTFQSVQPTITAEKVTEKVRTESTIRNDGENEALKQQITELKNEVESLKVELAKKDNTKSLRVSGFGVDVRDLEEELFKAQHQYDLLGVQIETTTDDSERLDLYIKRITLLEKIMQLGSGIEKLKNSAFEMRPQQQPRENRSVYYKMMEQVRRLNERIDNIERRRNKRNDDDYYSGNL